jgi:hypothetical protein
VLSAERTRRKLSNPKGTQKEVRFQRYQFDPHLPRLGKNHGAGPDDCVHIEHPRSDIVSGIPSTWRYEEENERIVRQPTMRYVSPATSEEIAWLERQKKSCPRIILPDPPVRLQRPAKFAECHEEYGFYPGRHIDREKCVRRKLKADGTWAYAPDRDRLIETRRLQRYFGLHGTLRFVPLNDRNSASRWLLCLVPQAEKFVHHSGVVLERVDGKLRKLYNDAIRRLAMKQWESECKRAKKVGLPLPPRPEYFNEPRERYARRHYVPSFVAQTNANPNSQTMGEDKTKGWAYRVILDFPQTTEGPIITRTQSDRAEALWRLEESALSGTLDKEKWLRRALCREMEFNAMSAADAADFAGLSEDYMRDEHEQWRRDVKATSRLFDANRLFEAPQDVWDDILANGGVWVILPADLERHHIEMHRLPSSDRGLIAGLLESNSSPLDFLQAELLSGDIAEIEAQARMQRSRPARERAIQKRREFRAWQFANGELHDFGPPGEFKAKLLREIRDSEARDDAEGEAA